MELSVVVPVYNETENVKLMIESLEKALHGIKHEMIFVDDGSTDRTAATIKKCAIHHKSVRLIELTRNYGQTSAMAAGIDHAKGTYIATMDGDLQNDPSDIPAMLEKLKREDLDIVSGIRRKRKDRFFFRKVPSKIANWLIRLTTGITIQDYGCTLKVFRAETAKQLDLYGELHRFIPILGTLQGAKIEQMPVSHHARQFGETKYGLSRTLKVMSDLMLMLFLLKFHQKPMHFFGILGLITLFIGGVIESYLLALKILGHDIGGRPLFYVGILLLITGIQLITTGFIAELLMRTYYGSQKKKPYFVKGESLAGDE